MGNYSLLYLGLLINTIIAVIFYFLPIIDRGMKRILCLIIFFIPFFGILGISIIFLMTRYNSMLEYDPYELSLKDEKLEYVQEINRLGDVNIVPIQEALLFNKDDIKRNMIIEIAKRDPKNYLDNLVEALLSDDTETAHYAASTIADIKRTFESQLQDAKKNYQEDSTSHNRVLYIECLLQSINSNLLVDNIKAKYTDELVGLLHLEIDGNPKLEESKIEKLVEIYDENQRYLEAVDVLKQYRVKYPKSDRPFLYMLNIAYKTNNNKLFESTIKSIESFKHPVTSDVMDLVDYWKNN